MVGGPETADFEGTLGVREISAGEGVSGQVRLSQASDIITGVLRLLRSQGRAAPSPASDKVLGSGWMALGAAGAALGWVSAPRQSPRPSAGPGRGSQGRAGPDAAPGTPGGP